MGDFTGATQRDRLNWRISSLFLDGGRYAAGVTAEVAAYYRSGVERLALNKIDERTRLIAATNRDLKNGHDRVQ